MQFNEQNKVIIDTMNRAEAKAFVLFLKSEIARHQTDISNAAALIIEVCDKFQIEGVVSE